MVAQKFSAVVLYSCTHRTQSMNSINYLMLCYSSQVISVRYNGILVPVRTSFSLLMWRYDVAM